MPTFYVALTIIAGEYHKTAYSLIQAQNVDLAQEYAVYKESHSPESLEWTDNGAADMGYEFFYEYYSAKEVPAEQIPVLTEYMNKFICNAEELLSSGNYKEWKSAEAA